MEGAGGYTGKSDLGVISGLRRTAEGLWATESEVPVSYPSDGLEMCAAVESSSFWFRHRNEVILCLMRRLPPPGALFDIGGGNGFVSLALQRAGMEVVLVEPDLSGARMAVSRGVQNVACSTVEQAGFQPGSLPAAGLFDVLEHIQDDVGFIASLHGLTRPGGRLYITVPAYEFLWSDADDYAGHQRRYTTSGLRRSLEDGGFEVEYVSYFFAPLAPAVFFARTLPGRLGRPTEKSMVSSEHHSLPNSWLGRAVGAMLAGELTVLERGGRLPTGGSCVAVARRR